MHALPALKQAALEAFETEDGPGDLAGFFSLIDPQSVLELVEIAETRITDEEVQAPHRAFGVLCGCIQRTTADPASIELTRHARMVVGANPKWAVGSPSSFMRVGNIYKFRET
jgi:hypothetical protein